MVGMVDSTLCYIACIMVSMVDSSVSVSMHMVDSTLCYIACIMVSMVDSSVSVSMVDSTLCYYVQCQYGW